MLFRASSAGMAVFTCSFQLRPEGRYKASVESAARPGYPNFGGTRKFVEAHGRGRRRKAERHLTLLPDAVTSHGKNSTPRCSDSRIEKAPHFFPARQSEYPVKTGFQNSDTDTKADTCEALVSVPLPAVPGNIRISCLNISR